MTCLLAFQFCLSFFFLQRLCASTCPTESQTLVNCPLHLPCLNDDVFEYYVDDTGASSDTSALFFIVRPDPFSNYFAQSLFMFILSSSATRFVILPSPLMAASSVGIIMSDLRNAFINATIDWISSAPIETLGYFLPHPPSPTPSPSTAATLYIDSRFFFVTSSVNQILASHSSTECAFLHDILATRSSFNATGCADPISGGPLAADRIWHEPIFVVKVLNDSAETENDMLASLEALSWSKFSTLPAPSFPVKAPVYVVGLVEGESPTACSLPANTSLAMAGKIALISRGECSFSTKVRNVQDHGAVGAAIYTTSTQPVGAMSCPEPTCSGATIPAFHITFEEVSITPICRVLICSVSFLCLLLYHHVLPLHFDPACSFVSRCALICLSLFMCVGYRA